jgi:molybdate transport system ATP-binding protein
MDKSFLLLFFKKEALAFALAQGARPMSPPPEPDALAGAVVYGAAVAIDDVMAEAIAELRQRGITVGGLLQHAGACGPAGGREMWLENIASGTNTRIDQPLGAGAGGCVLDEGGLVAAAAVLAAIPGSDVAVAVVNRFGKSEAAGRGLRDEIADILLAGIPVLIPVRDDLVQDWEAFIGAEATRLPPEPAAIRRWAMAQASRSAVLA